MFDREAYEKRTRWYREARFGMFIHWGLYAIPARAAKGAGMKYVVFTAKHHDGFCLFDSALTNFKSTNTPCGRDIVREVLDAFRAEGLRDEVGRELLWEACVTMNDHWGYCRMDQNYKSAVTLIRRLVECVSKNGNLLLNVGPDARGNYPDMAFVKLSASPGLPDETDTVLEIWLDGEI